MGKTIVERVWVPLVGCVVRIIGVNPAGGGLALKDCRDGDPLIVIRGVVIGGELLILEVSIFTRIL